MNEDKTYPTKDLQLSAFLHASDIKILDVRKNEAHKTVFVFENDNGKTQRMALAFYNHDDLISASKLLWSFEQLKNLLYDPNFQPVPQRR